MDMKQQEIEFFWPLTQQISLDLDYSPCSDSSAFSALPGLCTKTIQMVFSEASEPH
jgi:hypothetical protein